MTDLTARLRAIGVELPEVEAYEKHRRENKDEAVFTLYGWLVNVHYADPALGAVVGRLEATSAELEARAKIAAELITIFDQMWSEVDEDHVATSVFGRYLELTGQWEETQP